MNRNFLLCSLVAISTGWWLGRLPVSEQNLNLDQQLVERMQRDSQFAQDCLSNAEHEFTPGFRAHRLLPEQRGQFREDQGRVLSTKDGRDLALMTPGFLVIQSPQSETHCYTRDGRLLFQSGRLVSQTGCPILGYLKGSDHLQPLQLPDGFLAESLQIDKAGLCRLSSTQLEPLEFRLALMAFEQPGKLQLIEGQTSLFAETPASGKPKPIADEDRQVCQGYLEVSNADDEELVHVIHALHRYCGLPERPADSAQPAAVTMPPAGLPTYPAGPLSSLSGPNVSVSVLGNGHSLPAMDPLTQAGAMKFPVLPNGDLKSLLMNTSEGARR